MSKKNFGLFMLIALIMTGCSLGDRTVTDGVEVSFDFSIPSFKSKLAETRSTLSRCIINLVGRLIVYNHETDMETEYSWFGDLNSSTFAIESNKTIVLKPGTYDFTLELTIDNFNYIGSVSFDGFQFDTVAFTISFIDIRDFEVIGAGGYDGIALDSDNQSFSIKMDLLRRALISGHLQTVLGIHVISNNSVPVNGAMVYINDEYKGLTGSNLFTTEGFLKVYQNIGECVIKASFEGKYGTVTIDVDALQIDNVEIVLDMDE